MISRKHHEKSDDEVFLETRLARFNERKNRRTILVVLAAIFLTPFSLIVMLPWWVESKNRDRMQTFPVNKREVFTDRKQNTKDSIKNKIVVEWREKQLENRRQWREELDKKIEIQEKRNKVLAEECKMLHEKCKVINEECKVLSKESEVRDEARKEMKKKIVVLEAQQLVQQTIVERLNTSSNKVGLRPCPRNR